MLAGVALASGVGVLIVLFGAPERAERHTLTVAQQQWNANRPEHYLISVRIITLHNSVSSILEVNEEQIVAGWQSDGKTPLSAIQMDELRGFFPIGNLFTLARKEIDQPKQWREQFVRSFPPLEQWLMPCALRTLPPTEYDDKRGYPRRLMLGFSACQLHRDGVELRVERFQTVPSTN
jgi:hypothetical protein